VTLAARFRWLGIQIKWIQDRKDLLGGRHQPRPMFGRFMPTFPHNMHRGNHILGAQGFGSLHVLLTPSRRSGTVTPWHMGPKPRKAISGIESDHRFVGLDRPTSLHHTARPMTLYHPRPERWPQGELKGFFVLVTLAGVLCWLGIQEMDRGPARGCGASA